MPGRKSVIAQTRVLLGVTLLNFAAQIPYFFRLYYHKPVDLLKLLNLPMGLVFALFLTAYALLVKGERAGYWLMLLFLFVEFFFYLWNVAGSYALGFGLFFQLRNPDLLLRSVFAVGYLNLFASGYFLCLLLVKKNQFIR